MSYPAPSTLRDGRYRITRRIGTGGMATVYEGEDTLLGRPIAVKILHSRHAEDAAVVAQFETEARALAALKHPGIVEVYDLGTDNGAKFIVMELVPGQPLKDLLGRGPLTAEQTIDIGVQMAKALESAHAAGVIHRDVKSQNIIVGPSGGAKLVDFGIATAEAGPGGDEDEVLGTVHYVAPERARGEPATPATDIYSLGIVLYEMATGHVPFDGATALQIATMHVNDQAPQPSSLNPWIPPHVEAAILHAIDKSPSRRPLTGGHLARELLAMDSLHDQTTRIVPTVNLSGSPQMGPSRSPSPGRIRGRPDDTDTRERVDGAANSSPWPLFVLAVTALVLVLGLLPLWAAVLEPGRI